MTAARAGMMAALGCALLAGCGKSPEDQLRAIADAALTAGRAATVASLQKTPSKGADWLNDAAFEAVERYRAKKEALVFAAAVLDVGKAVERDLGANSLLLFNSLGLLAFQAADDAMRRGDLATARSVVLGGPAAWQTERYWLANPEHDGLASIILFECGDRNQALDRIDTRALASEHLQQVQTMLRKRPAKPANNP